MELLSMCGYKSMGSFVKAKIPKIAMATNISAVEIGFLTADEYKLILNNYFH